MRSLTATSHPVPTLVNEPSLCDPVAQGEAVRAPGAATFSLLNPQTNALNAFAPISFTSLCTLIVV
jgi:hypothetical protein